MEENVKNRYSILFFLNLTSLLFIQSVFCDNFRNEIGNLKKGIVPSVSPILGGIFPAGYVVSSISSEKNLSADSVKYGAIGASFAGSIVSYFLYNRTPIGIKNQAKKLLETLRSEDNLLGIKEDYIQAEHVSNIDYDALFTKFYTDIQHPEDLNSKIECLKCVNDYSYYTLQEIKWLIPKLRQLQKNGDQESGNLASKLIIYDSFVRSLRIKCSSLISTLQEQLRLNQSNQIKADHQKANVKSKTHTIEFKKDKNRRENLKAIHELRKVVYDWRWLISSGLAASVGGSSTIQAFCMKKPLLVMVLGIGIAGTLFLPPLSSHGR